MAYQSFEELEVWQLARKFAENIYQALAERRDFGFKNQIIAAACSISNNITEGSERIHRNEFVQVLGYAKGSAGETWNQLHLAADLGYIPSARAEQLRADIRVIGGKLYTLIAASVHRNLPLYS